MAEKPETTFKRRIRPQLEALPKTWVVKVQQVATVGTPDFLLCVNGRFVALELKAHEKAKIAKIQSYVLERISHSAGIALVVFPENWQSVFGFLKGLANGEKNDLDSVPIFPGTSLLKCPRETGSA